MKLELKHLAPYLPYKLPIQITESFYNPYNKEPIQKKDNIVKLDCFAILLMQERLMFKPILRPLSDLTKEIEVNGERFVPVEKMYEGKLSIWEKDIETYGVFYDYVMEMNEHDLPEEMTYNQIQILLEWHFDVFGLIDQGLAVDINTLNK